MNLQNYNELRIGDLFAVDLQNGHFGLIQIIDSNQHNGQTEAFGKNNFVFAALDWYKEKPPYFSDFVRNGFLEKLFKKNNLPSILRRKSFKWENRPETLYVLKESFPSRRFILQYLGNLHPVHFDASWNRSIGVFDSIPEAIIQEWRWKHDRVSLEKEVNEKQRIENEAREQQKTSEVKWLAKVKLSDLKDKNPFEHWKRLWPEKVVIQAEKICEETLIKLEDADKNSKQQVDAIVYFIESFNKLNQNNNEFIETEEREDIYEFYRKMCTIAKIAEYEETFGKLKKF